METRNDDVVYIVAVRTRAPNRGRAIQEVLRILNLARADDEADVYATVMAKPLAEMYSFDNSKRLGGNGCEILGQLGFTLDEANQVVPVFTEESDA